MNRFESPFKPLTWISRELIGFHLCIEPHLQISHNEIHFNYENHQQQRAASFR
jgi:hypothetical protein